eukprot:666209-Prymnesium_polylepis.2
MRASAATRTSRTNGKIARTEVSEPGNITTKRVQRHEKVGNCPPKVKAGARKSLAPKVVLADGSRNAKTGRRAREHGHSEHTTHQR